MNENCCENSLFASIEQSWNLVKKNMSYFFGLTLIFTLVYLVLYFIVPFGLGIIFGVFGLILGYIVFMVLYALLCIGYIKSCFAIMRGEEKLSYAILFTQTKKLLNLIIGSILFSLICIGGFILLIVPGIIWSLKYRYYFLFILDKGMKPVEALKASALITKGYKGKLFTFTLFQGVIVYMGIFVFLVGIFVAVPVAMIANYIIYQKLLAIYEKKNGPLKIKAEQNNNV